MMLVEVLEDQQKQLLAPVLEKPEGKVQELAFQQ